MALPIESVTLRIVELPLVHPFRTSFGVQEDRRTLILEVASDGRRGWGESPVAAFPGYAYETVDTALHVLSDFLLPALPGWDAHGEGMPDIFKKVSGHLMAKSGVDGALCDLRSLAAGQPLHRWLGGSVDRIPVGVSVGIQPTVPALLERIERFVAQGYGRVKIKIEPGWDVSVVEAVRNKFPDLPLWVDANQAYALDDLALFQGLASFRLDLIEQPFPKEDLLSHGRLAAQIDTPICLDESICTVGDLASAQALGALAVLNIKNPRVGGPSAALALHDAARDLSIPVWCGGMLETGIGRLHNMALATLPNFQLPGDISASSRYFHRDLIDPPVLLKDKGTLLLPSEPGIDCRVDRDALEAFTVRTVEFH